DAIFREALQISTALWTGETVEFAAASSDDTDAKLKSGDARRNELNHYLGGTIFYEGEWYWGVDRIQYLEDRLRGLGLGEAGQPFIYSQPIVPEGEGGPATGVDLHYYASFRSPYTYIAVDRVKALADAYGANLKIRFVLPMVMRGLTVPRRKGGYIIKDVAREANRIGVPFGKIADPVGKPVERAYSILPWAIEQGRGYEFTRSFLAHVWSKGTDAGSDRGLKTITEEAGLSWDHARKLIGTEDWKPIEDANQEEMLSYGQWGVPSFRVGDVMVWGQDRLWVIENELKRHQAN
ncbi:MAG: DsbA family protein, partial [Pseudomonadota bacterium]